MPEISCGQIGELADGKTDGNDGYACDEAELVGTQNNRGKYCDER